MTSQFPQVLAGRYEIRDLIGRGGMAEVHLGYDTRLSRVVAIKLLRSDIAGDPTFQARFRREAQSAAALNHPAVVAVYDSGEEELLQPGGASRTVPYIVMEYVEGHTVRELLSEGEAVPIPEAVEIVSGVLDALEYSHRVGIVHRDIKPGNILIDAYGGPRLSDFGLAAIQREGIDSSVTLETMTPNFAPPEAFTLAAPSPRGDVWSMGAVLFALLTGRGPRRTADGAPQSLPEIINHLSVPVDTSDTRIPEVLRPLLDRALHPDPAQRYRDGNELTEALTRAGELSNVALNAPHSALRPPHPRPASIPTPTDGSRHSSRALMLLALGVTAGVVISAAVLGAIRLIDSVPSASRASQRASASPIPHAGARAEQGAGSHPSTTTWATVPGSRKASPSPSTAPAPAQVNAQGIPYSDGMPWPLGTCLSRTTSVVGGTSISQADCSQADWIVFAGGTFDPATTASTATEAMRNDPQVTATCTSDYAQRYGLDLSTSYTINTLGPNDEEWAAGSRGFACVLGRL